MAYTAARTAEYVHDLNREVVDSGPLTGQSPQTPSIVVDLNGPMNRELRRRVDRARRKAQRRQQGGKR
jgi:hypothetical protein